MDKLLLYNVSKRYYLDNASQQEIANETGYSRSQISRFLKDARDSGMVEITIHPPFQAPLRETEETLRSVLGLSSVSILDTSSCNEDDLDRRISMTAEYTARYLSGIIPSCRKVGIGWGHTIYSIVLATDYRHAPIQTVFVPMTGASGFIEPYHQTNSIVDRFAEKYRAGCEFLNSPAFIIGDMTQDEMLRSLGLDKPDSLWKNMDLAVFSLGGTMPSNRALQNLPDKTLIRTVEAYEAVGDILGYFYNRNGKALKYGKGSHHIAMPPAQLKKVPSRICIAVGKDKAAAIIAAAKGDFLTELITDHYTASSIMENL